MSYLNILLIAVTTNVLTAVVIFLLKDWIKTRLKESIGAEYKKALEIFKGNLEWEAKKKEQAIQIAKLFSLWMRFNYYPEGDINNDRYYLQHEYWQLAMWLDAPILKVVNQAFTYTGTPGLAHKEALIAVRKLLFGEDDPITAGELCHWDAIRPASLVGVVSETAKPMK
jgi:hypothetical protein